MKYHYQIVSNDMVQRVYVDSCNCYTEEKEYMGGFSGYGSELDAFNTGTDALVVMVGAAKRDRYLVKTYAIAGAIQHGK